MEEPKIVYPNQTPINKSYGEVKIKILNLVIFGLTFILSMLCTILIYLFKNKIWAIILVSLFGILSSSIMNYHAGKFSMFEVKE